MEFQQVHELGDTGPREPVPPGQLGSICYVTRSDKALEFLGLLKHLDHRRRFQLA